MKKIQNSRVNSFFKKLLVSKIEDIHAKIALQGNTVPLTELLFRELQKPKLKDQFFKKSKSQVIEPTDNERDIGKIVMILKLMPEIRKFLKYNNIDYDAIRQAANYIEYRKIEKGKYIFRQGEKSDYFYGIINGKVSIRTEEKILVTKSCNEDLSKPTFVTAREHDKVFVETIEHEKLTLNPGQYFGDWGILERKERTASAFAVEDTDLFYIDAKAFESSFGRCILKSENERKNFLTKLIQPLREITRNKFNIIYKTMFVQHLLKNEPVYVEGTEASMLYVVYEGVFRLQKKNLFGDKKEDEDFYRSDINKHHVILKLGKGDFAGIECLKNFQHNNNLEENQLKHKYKYTLVSENEYNVIIAINPKNIGADLREKLYTFFQPIVDQKENILSNILQNHMLIKNKMKLTFREELMKQLAKNNKQFFKNQIDKQVEVEADNFQAEMLRMKKITPNEVKNIRYKFLSEDNTIMEYSQQPSINVKNTVLTNRLKKVTPLKLGMTRENSTLSMTHFNRDSLVPSWNISAQVTNRGRTKIFTGPSSPRDASEKDQTDNYIINTEREERKSVQRMTLTRKETPERKNTNILMSNLPTESKFDHDPNSAQLSPEHFHRKSYKNTTKSIQFLIKNILKRGTNKKPKQDDTKKHVHKFIAKSVDTWKKSQVNKKTEYSTGNYQLPLVSQMKLNYN